ncbi:glycosyltransferase family A protein [Salegentibacter sp. Hel_I_6]|uniref:glycosyltransferase family A protein n=1 Tax=Salegentibacter sp. Hel_I_6 TaxID=1250278 RepID=UPI00068BB39A|nr:glycosyltransferase family 2 protein [Salegentibacter sp. Hel_I_6]
MRKGLNPNKDKTGGINYLHQVIIPIYIPNQEGYFEESLQVLEICIESLLRSSRPYTFISLVNNGSCSEVEEYILDLYKEGKVQEIIVSANIGKYNSIIKAVSGHNIPLVTISDADVFFKENWQEETYKIFQNFKKVGVVGLIPQFLSYQSHSENLLFDYSFSSKLKFANVKEPEALAGFYESIGWKPNYPKERLKFTLYLNNGGFEAIVGSGHVVASYRREILQDLAQFNPFKMGGNSEELLDETAPKKGYYRFTTPKNMAFHLGNKLDNKFLEKMNLGNNFTIKEESFPDIPAFIYPGFNWAYFLKRKLIQLILKSHKLRMLYLKQLGMPEAARKSF